MHLYQTLLESSLPEQEAAQVFLKQYFPEKIRTRYAARIKDHPLKREIIATMITNRVVDQAGCAFLNTLVRQAGATMIQGVTAYLIFDEVLAGTEVRDRIMAADNQMPAQRQYELLIGLEKALAGLCAQAIEQDLPLSLAKSCVQTYRQRLSIFRSHLPELLPPDEWQACRDAAASLTAEGFTEDMALALTSFRYLAGFLPAVYIAEATGSELLKVTTAMARMRLQLKMSQVMESLRDYAPHDRWDRMALATLQSAFIRETVNLTRVVVAAGLDVGVYLAGKRQRLDYYLAMLENIKATPPNSTSPYMVLLRALESIEN
jgi:glutamate dehydrogenase